MYPICLDLRARRVLIVGGGALALQKLRTLEGSGAQVQVVAPELRGPWPEEDAARGFRLVRAAYEPAHLVGAYLVFAATDDAGLNHRVVAEARAAGILANAVDDPEHCDFHTPAVLRRGQVTLALSTDGAFPGVTRALREVLDAWLPTEDQDLLNRLFELRAALRRNEPSPAARRAALQGLVERFKGEYLTPAPGTEVARS